ncbi:MAG TPA: protein kinase [Candidatus Saccharimonadales bacterium]|nr:protein kinase [Candidatus Saccharimonadales bacterium]
MPAPGTMLLHYRLEEIIGEGGMGVVWRARDTTLDREVAIKILPEALASEADRLARFEREAKALAALNHPNIASVYGLHEAGGVRFLAMELAPGEELLRLIKRGPVPLDDALRIARAIASALEAAHEAGIVHRDLKPANVMVSPEGSVKVLDFGLAKNLDQEAGAVSGSMSPTLTTPATRSGVIMGTAAYMSPEQARGRAVDKRADIWAFGVVLWEMLAGDRAFKGETVSDTLASVLKETPDLDALPALTPAAVRRLVARCLEKDPKQRLRDIGEARIALSGDLEAGAAAQPDAAPRPSRRMSLTASVILLVAGAAIGSLAIWALAGGSGEVPRAPSMLLAIPLDGDHPPGSRLSRPVAISPRGDRVVYVAVKAESSEIFSKGADEPDMKPIESTEGYIDPFFSPDGTKLGLLDARQTDDLKLGWIDLAAPGRVQVLADYAVVGAVWGEDGYVYFTYTKQDSPDTMLIHRVADSGGTPERVTHREAGSKETHWWPELLPGAGKLLFAKVPNFEFGKSEIDVLDLKTGAEKLLIPDARQARYVRSGHLVYLQKDTLLAVRFDPVKAEITGKPVAILSGVKTNPDSGSAAFAFSRNGTLVYLSEDSTAASARLMRYDPKGNGAPLVSETADYRWARASRDGRRVAASVLVRPGKYQLQIHNIQRRTFATPSVGDTVTGVVWSPDGQWVYYAVPDLSSRMTAINRIRADGSGQPETICKTQSSAAMWDISPDGRWLVLSDSAGASIGMAMVPADGKGKVQPLIATDANEGNARISPDGRYVAYVDDSLGRAEIFLRTFPKPGEAWRISTKGGNNPAWSPDGRRILFLQDQDVMSADIGAGSEPEPREPVKLFTLKGPAFAWAGLGDPSLQVLPDGTIMIIQPDAEHAAPGTIRVVTNWFDQLNSQVP